jgi:glycosyltransferase involved in cell wall biosynthesis
MIVHPLKIAIVSVTLPEPGRKFGGVDVVVHRLANELAKVDHVTVFTVSPSIPDSLYEHSTLFRGMSWLANKKSRLTITPILLNFLRFDQFDVLSLHGDDWFYFFRTCPTVRTFHGSALMESRTATSIQRKLGSLFVYQLERLAVRLSTKVVCVGSGTAKLFGAESIVDNGVDTGVFFPGKKVRHPRIMFVGTWQGRKRGRFVYESFLKDILPQLPDAELCMVCDYCPPHPNVIIEMFPSDEKLAQLYREAWVFAYPSLYEGFGLAYSEALASGTAIVCSPNEGAARVLCNGRFGMIVQDASFSSAVLELLQNSKTRTMLEASGIVRASELSWSSAAEQYRLAFRSVLDE